RKPHNIMTKGKDPHNLRPISLPVPPQPNNTNRKRNTRQPSARPVQTALALHLPLNSLTIQITLSLDNDKILVLLRSRVPDQREMRDVADDGGGPVLEAQVAVEPEVN